MQNREIPLIIGMVCVTQWAFNMNRLCIADCMFVFKSHRRIKHGYDVVVNTDMKYTNHAVVPVA